MSQQIAVIGAGLMGAGIAQVSAQAGYDVVLRDISDDATARGLATIQASYAKLASKDLMSTADVDAALARITTTTDLHAIDSADLVVEAVFEKLEVKTELFASIDRIAKPGAVLATQHVGTADHPDRGGHLPSRGGRRHALLLARAR